MRAQEHAARLLNDVGTPPPKKNVARAQKNAPSLLAEQRNWGAPADRPEAEEAGRRQEGGGAQAARLWLRFMRLGTPSLGTWMILTTMNMVMWDVGEGRGDVGRVGGLSLGEQE